MPLAGSSESQELFAVVSSSVMIRRKKKGVLTQLPLKQREQIFLEIPKAERTSKIQPIVQAMNALPETETLERKMLMNKYYLSTAEAKVKTVQNYLQNLLESIDEEKKILFAAAPTSVCYTPPWRRWRRQKLSSFASMAKRRVVCVKV